MAEQELARENKRLRELAADAIEDLESWAGYASEYFQTKHDFAGTLADLRNRLESKMGDECGMLAKGIVAYNCVCIACGTLVKVGTEAYATSTIPASCEDHRVYCPPCGVRENGRRMMLTRLENASGGLCGMCGQRVIPGAAWYSGHHCLDCGNAYNSGYAAAMKVASTEPTDKQDDGGLGHFTQIAHSVETMRLRSTSYTSCMSCSQNLAGTWCLRAIRNDDVVFYCISCVLAKLESPKPIAKSEPQDDGGPAYPGLHNVAHNSDWISDEGMSLRTRAAIDLKVPCSEVPFVNDMIREMLAERSKGLPEKSNHDPRSEHSIVRRPGEKEVGQ